MPRQPKLANEQIADQLVPRFDIYQADAAPLMASLIGVAVPVNNFGTLPSHYLNCSKVRLFAYQWYKYLTCLIYDQCKDYISRAMFGNALQMAQQYKFLHHEFADGAFSRLLSDYEPLNERISKTVEQLIATLIGNGQFEKAVNLKFTSTPKIF